MLYVLFTSKKRLPFCVLKLPLCVLFTVRVCELTRVCCLLEGKDFHLCVLSDSMNTCFFYLLFTSMKRLACLCAVYN